LSTRGRLPLLFSEQDSGIANPSGTLVLSQDRDDVTIYGSRFMDPMDSQPLDFEKPVLELQRRLQELKSHSDKHDIDFDSEVESMELKIRETRRDSKKFGVGPSICSKNVVMSQGAN